MYAYAEQYAPTFDSGPNRCLRHADDADFHMHLLEARQGDLCIRYRTIES